MSYDNAEPKVLKTLNSSGQVLDDAGNVINDTSDYWVQLYNQTEPKVDKILKSDGTIVDAAGNLIQDTTEFNVKKYNQAEPIPAKYLHSDGTIDENPGGGSGANLQDNKQVDITSNGEVEITPDTGYDGMKKVTANVTVSGGGDSVTFYAWEDESQSYYRYTLSATPSVGDNAYQVAQDGYSPSYILPPSVITAVGEGSITYKNDEDDIILLRKSEGDITYAKSSI